MSYIINDAALKYRESENDQWETAVVHADAEVQAVVQSSEPTGTETLWFDNSNQTDVQVPTFGEFQALEGSIGSRRFGYTITGLNGATVVDYGVWASGRVVTVFVVITLGSTVTRGTAVADGFPKPFGGYNSLATGVSVSQANDEVQPFSVQGNCQLEIHGKNATANKNYRICMTYPTNELPLD